MDNDMYIRTRMNELHPDLNHLVEKLVSYGGNTVNLPYDMMNKRIFDEGGTYWNDIIPYAMGSKELCHKNAWELHTQHGWGLNTGYVLGTDNAWYRHSWAINKNFEIVETSYPENTKLYYGIALDEQEYLEMLLLMGQIHVTISVGGFPSPFRL